MKNPFAHDVLHGPHHYRPEWDVFSVNSALTDRLTELVPKLKGACTTDDSRRIEVLLAAPGHGKTHVFGRIAHRLRQEVLFVFVPQVEDPQHPLDHIRRSTVESLFRSPVSQGYSHLEILLARILGQSFVTYFDWLPATLRAEHDQIGQCLRSDPLAVLEVTRKVPSLRPFLALAKSVIVAHPEYRADVIQALVLSLSCSRDKVRRWLRGESLSEEDLSDLNLGEEPPLATDVLKSVSVLLRDEVPIVICCDQLEAVLEVENGSHNLANGLVKLLQEIPNLLLVVSCHEDRWSIFSQETMFADRTLTTNLDFPTPVQLIELVRKRLASWEGSRQEQMQLWPFDLDAMKIWVSKNQPAPRGLLKVCAAAFQEWLETEDRNGPIILNGSIETRLESLFREEWDQQLAVIQQGEGGSRNTWMNPDFIDPLARR